MSDSQVCQIIRIAVLGFFCLYTSVTVAGSRNLDSLPPDGVRIAEALHQFGPDCRSTDCQTLRTISQLGDIMAQAHETPMKVTAIGAIGRAQVARDVAPARIDKLLRSALFDRPKYYQSICTRLVNVIRNYNESKPHASDGTVVLQLIEIAELIDTRTHGQCLPDMLAQLPYTPQVAEIVSSARGDCENSQWHNPGCRRIRRPETVK